MTSSIYPLNFTIADLPITGSTDILSTPITILPIHVSPGGGGILRLYFSFDFIATPTTVSVTNNGVLKGNLNADNNAEVVDDGYYRFDIDVEVNDVINLKSISNIVTVNVFRAHLVQFGA